MQLKINLGTIAEIISGFHFRKSVKESSEKGTAILQATNIDKLRHTIDLTALKKTTDAPPRNDSYVKINDVVLAVRGNQPGNYKAAVVDDITENIIATSSVNIIRIKDTTLYSPHFLALYLNSTTAQKQLFDLTSGATIKFLTRTSIANFEVPKVPIEMQHNLVQLSEVISQESSILEQKLALTQNLLQSIITKYSTA